MPLPLARLQPVLFSRAVPTLVWLCVLGLGAWYMAGWYWRLAAPEASNAFPVPLSDPKRASEEIASRHLFGLPQKSLTETASPLPLNIHVIGVMTASRNGPGFAVIQDEGKSSDPILEGEEIVPGMKLERVMPQSIEISRNGHKETIPLEFGQKMQPPPLLSSPQPLIQNQPQPDVATRSPSFRKSRLSLMGEGRSSKTELEPND